MKTINMFYTYSQNNSSCSFEINDNLKHYVIIEADTEQEADVTAEYLGIYFDGVEDGMDCPCCGDRWYRAEYCDVNEDPLVYGKSPKEYVNSNACFNEQVIVYYKDGRKEVF
ncbi:MAG: hypothetical protein NC222_06330 [Staphylococcus sp.]|nr:hypothetical protein [Staphylococcus sp.]